LSFIGNRLQRTATAATYSQFVLFYSGFVCNWGHSSDFHLTLLHEFLFNH
jgi:hypothetical protein